VRANPALRGHVNATVGQSVVMFVRAMQYVHAILGLLVHLVGLWLIVVVRLPVEAIVGTLGRHLPLHLALRQHPVQPTTVVCAIPEG
jgi:hypothetical protein